MCGIAGYIEKSSRNAEKAKVKLMTDAIKHRGPDAEGQWVKNNVGLGHRRLAIIDLDATSNQPMLSHDGRFVISFNGEIYNYIELREELEALGAKFKTNSDTEVILESYRYYGEDCFNRFNGMWAFCIYDISKKKIILSRDRFGIKPLYILDREDVFAFGSEVKAILAAFPEENIPDMDSIYRYISGTVNENVDEKCFYKNIRIFPPAKYMIYDLDKHAQKYVNYWNVDEEQFREKWIKGKNPIATFKYLLEDAISLRLRADVEVGACLSGGLDSSAIVGCASHKYGKKMHTFSSVYDDEDCNEEKYMRAVNEKWETQAHYIRPDDYETDFSDYIRKITFYHDGPTQGASLYSQYMVMNGVHEHVKVVLDGQGADELFAGYIPYFSHYIEDLMHKGGFFNRLKAIKTLAIVNTEWNELIGNISTDIIVQLVGVNNSFRFLNKRAAQNAQTRRSQQLFTDCFLKQVNHDYKPPKYECASLLNTRLCEDVMFRSIPALLHNEDSNSMAFSIESRVPFLDYRIVEFAIALDEKYKIKDCWTKWIIRKSCKSYLPKEVIKRKNKMGFPAPFSRWLREGKSKDEIKDIIFAFAERNIVPKSTIENLYHVHMSGESDVSAILFKYYNMELWLRTCNDFEIGVA